MKNCKHKKCCPSPDGGGGGGIPICRLAPIRISTPANCRKLPCLRVISGQGEPEKDIVIKIDCGRGPELELAARTSDSGSFRICVSENLCPGYHTIEAAYRHHPECPASTVWVFIEEPIIIPAPVIIFPADGSTISDDMPVITGTAMPGSLVIVTTRCCDAVSALADGLGEWSVQFETPFTPGEQVICATQRPSECAITGEAYSVFRIEFRESFAQPDV